MGFSFRSTGGVKRAKECWNESHAINGSAPAATRKTRRREPGVPPAEHPQVFGSVGHTDKNQCAMQFDDYSLVEHQPSVREGTLFRSVVRVRRGPGPRLS
jgi:hypothetical protein